MHIQYDSDRVFPLKADPEPVGSDPFFFRMDPDLFSLGVGPGVFIRSGSSFSRGLDPYLVFLESRIRIRSIWTRIQFFSRIVSKSVFSWKSDPVALNPDPQLYLVPCGSEGLQLPGSLRPLVKAPDPFYFRMDQDFSSFGGRFRSFYLIRIHFFSRFRKSWKSDPDPVDLNPDPVDLNPDPVFLEECIQIWFSS